jgi:hypothetical protein
MFASSDINTESRVKAMATAEKSSVGMRWLAAGAIAAGLAVGIVASTAVASADTGNVPDGDTQGESETPTRDIARKAQWNRAIQQIDKHNVGIAAGTTTRKVTTKKVTINLTRVSMKGSA